MATGHTLNYTKELKFVSSLSEMSKKKSRKSEGEEMHKNGKSKHIFDNK